MLPTVGADVNVWGAKLNSNFSLLDSILATLTTSGLTRYTNDVDGGITATANSHVWTLAVSFLGGALVFSGGVLLTYADDYTTSGDTITFVEPQSGNITVLQ